MRRLRRPQGIGFFPKVCHNHGLDACSRRAAFETVDTARCPRCGGRLVARMGRSRPYFYCLCIKGRRSS